MAANQIQVVFFDIGNTLVRNAQSWVPGAQDAIARLRAADLRLGLISNTGDLDQVALAAHLPSNFNFQDFDDDLVLLSKEVGIVKPDLRIFLQAVRQAAVSSWHCLFVGENLVETFSAQQAGMCRLSKSGFQCPVSMPEIWPSLSF